MALSLSFISRRSFGLLSRSVSSSSASFSTLSSPLRTRPILPTRSSLPLPSRLSPLRPRRTLFSSPKPLPRPGTDSTPETDAYVADFLKQARKAGYTMPQIAKMIEAEAAAGRMPTSAASTARASVAANGLVNMMLVFTIFALLVVPAARYASRRFAVGGDELDKRKDDEWKKRVVVDAPKPRRLGDRGDGE